ncbi:hypothetical protein EDC02_4995 [Micromonospora sp. Llam0]|uniref:hypothetical protein n=1 Tax=Micromonospora sp. Llam0 TaxID=2485143 RepID=UPI000F98D619|nr:hypothetical protein [Micromonospora sp. Llam0]ROO62986.1 hypothetical protein EDC02_4995 [Micromonospora sp. Llam0]
MPDQPTPRQDTPARPRRQRQPPRGDSGAVTIQVLYIAVIGLLFAAALYGGATILAARSHGYSLAQSAARAGAQHIDLAHYRATGQIRLDPGPAAQAAKQYLAAAGATGTVDTVTLAEITVTATSTQATPALRSFGYDTVTVTSTASATATATV